MGQMERYRNDGDYQQKKSIERERSEKGKNWYATEKRDRNNEKGSESERERENEKMR